MMWSSVTAEALKYIDHSIVTSVVVLVVVVLFTSGTSTVWRSITFASRYIQDVIYLLTVLPEPDTIVTNRSWSVSLLHRHFVRTSEHYFDMI